MQVGCIIGGIVLILGGLYALLEGESAYRETFGYRSLEWLSDLPRHERLLSCLALAWMLAVVLGIMWEASRGRLPAIAYIAVAAILFVVWRVILSRLDHLMARTVQDGLNYSSVRKSGAVLIALGLVLIIVGIML